MLLWKFQEKEQGTPESLEPAWAFGNHKGFKSIKVHWCGKGPLWVTAQSSAQSTQPGDIAGQVQGMPWPKRAGTLF